MAESTVLVVDDEPLIVDFLAENLRADDFSVLTAGTGSEAMEVLAASRPDVLLLDVVLPDMSGLRRMPPRPRERPDHLGMGPGGADHHALRQGRAHRPRPRTHPGRGRLRDEAVPLPGAPGADRRRAHADGAGAERPRAALWRPAGEHALA